MTGRSILLAVVTTVLCAAMFAGDLGWISDKDAHAWDVVGSIFLGVDLAWVVFGPVWDRLGRAS